MYKARYTAVNCHKRPVSMHESAGSHFIGSLLTKLIINFIGRNMIAMVDIYKTKKQSCSCHRITNINKGPLISLFGPEEYAMYLN